MSEIDAYIDSLLARAEAAEARERALRAALEALYTASEDGAEIIAGNRSIPYAPWVQRFATAILAARAALAAADVPRE